MQENIELAHEIIHLLSLISNVELGDKIDKYRNLLLNFTNSYEKSNIIVDHVEMILNNAEKIINNAISNDAISNIVEIIENNEIIDTTCADDILRIALLRNTIIQKSKNYCIYNKKKYLFDNVYSHEKNDDTSMIDEIYNFNLKRIQSQKDSCILLYGYTGSGKSFAYNQILNKYNNIAYKFYLSEIYLNTLYVYDHRIDTKIKITDMKKFNQEYYIFDSTIIKLQEIIKKFKSVNQTNLNTNSSRSHLILSLYILNEQSNTIKYTRVTIFDCAGNEKIDIKCDDKDMKKKIEKESIYINGSLYNLSSYLQNTHYKKNSCILLSELKKYKNIVFILFCNDISEKCTSGNHLICLKKLLS